MEESQQQDICRVCRSEATPDKPLYHPCICTGSIKYIHQDCLVQWLKYSRKEYCELCNHRFAFMPIYSPDMPKRLPIKDILSGLISSLGTAVRYWLHYTLVASAWLLVVPLTACRIHRCLFTGSVSSYLTLPLDMLSAENLLADSFYGCCVVTCTLCTFISLVWLREQILHGGGPDWLDQDNNNNNNNVQQQQNAGVVNQAAIEGEGEADDEGEEEAVLAEGDGGEIPLGGENAPNEAQIENDNPMDGNNVAQDDNNWNPIEWDRAAEELTWERLLGLDGSLIFLEHVFWVVSLNTFFILVFAFCPYHIGHFALIGLKLKEYVVAVQFEGLLTTLCGYVVIGIVLVVLHLLASIVRLKKTKRLLGLCYIVVKVSLLSVVEIGLFPLVCGWWLDICSLKMLDATLADREASFKMAPGTSMFIHWLVGMVYVFQFASFILLLREVLRPGVLWFLRNLNDPDFSPIQEMIHLPILRHIRRFLASLVIFGTTVLLMVWLPVILIEKVLPGFLPYNVVLSSDAPVGEFSLELVLLQVILPALLEQGQTRQWLKALVRAWCIAVSYVLDLRSYLLGDEPEKATEGIETAHLNQANNPDEPVMDNEPEDIPLLNPNVVPEAQPEEIPVAAGVDGMRLDLAAAHQALVQGGGATPTGFQPYRCPSFFPLRILALIVIIYLSLVLASLTMLTIPVFLGRKLMSLWMGATKVHELYTAACGLYACWLFLRCVAVLCNWFPKGWNAVFSKVVEWLTIMTKSLVALAVLLGLLPLLMGLLVDVVFIVPLRVPLNQTPIIYLWQDWALGVLHTKIVCAVTLMGPNWWLKRIIEQVYHDGIRQINLKLILIDLAVPVVTVLGLALAVPYILAVSVLPMLGVPESVESVALRSIYPSMVAAFCFIAVVVFQVLQFCRLYEHIRNDKYLVGKRLVNYEHKRFSNQNQTTAPPVAAPAPPQDQFN